MLNILSYSVLEFASGFAPSLTILIFFRALFGVAMGGEWGVGASLTLESIPAAARGLVSGILQAGYPSGYLLASIANYTLHDLIGWRGMFMIGIAPALIVFHIRRSVDESPSFQRQDKPPTDFMNEIRKNWGLFLWAIAMMTAFNFFSHGTQDMYPTFLQQQRDLSTHQVSIIAVIYNIGAILGGLTFGVLSNRIGRKKAIMLAALLALPAIPLWTLSTSVAGLAAGSFLIQFFVQGAWGVVPAHLNELSPETVRGVFPGFAYQLGNLIASYNATLQAGLAADHHGNYAMALSLVISVTSIALVAIVGFGREARGKKL